MAHFRQFAHLSIGGGSLDSEVEISFAPDSGPTLGGTVSVAGLELADSRDNKRLLAWEKFHVDRFTLDPNADGLHLSRVLFERPFARLEIREDRSTNLDGLLISGDSAPAEGGDGSIGLIVGGTSIGDGSLDFSDLSLPLPSIMASRSAIPTTKPARS